jgi:hypothetical protein
LHSLFGNTESDKMFQIELTLFKDFILNDVFPSF